MKFDHIKARLKKDLMTIEEKARTSDREMSDDTIMLIKNLAKAYYYVHEAQEKIMEDEGIMPYAEDKAVYENNPKPKSVL